MVPQHYNPFNPMKAYFLTLCLFSRPLHPPPPHPLENQSPPLYLSRLLRLHTDKKRNQIFLIYKEIQKGSIAKSYIYDYRPSYTCMWLNICAIPHILGSSSSYMTTYMQLIPPHLNFLIYEENFDFFFISAYVHSHIRPFYTHISP